MIIKVTKKDINSAIRRGYDGTSCPIARAMRRCGLKNPSVNPADGDFSYSTSQDEEAMWMNRVTLKIPRSVERFVKAFDARYEAGQSQTMRRKASKALIRPFAFLVRKKS